MQSHSNLECSCIEIFVFICTIYTVVCKVEEDSTSAQLHPTNVLQCSCCTALSGMRRSRQTTSVPPFSHDALQCFSLPYFSRHSVVIRKRLWTRLFFCSLKEKFLNVASSLLFSTVIVCLLHTFWVSLVHFLQFWGGFSVPPGPTLGHYSTIFCSFLSLLTW